LENNTEHPINTLLGEESSAMLWGYDSGLIWEYKNPYAPTHPFWTVYLYGYILGVMNIMPEDS